MTERDDPRGPSPTTIGHRPSRRPDSLADALATPDVQSPEDVRALWDGLTVPAPMEAPAPPVEPWVPDGDVLGGEIDARAPISPPRTDEDEPASRRSVRKARHRARKAERVRKRTELMQHRRYRVLPRSLLGISAMLVAFAVGAGASGAVLYAYYDWRLSQNEDRVGALATNLEDRLTEAHDAIDGASAQAVDEIRTEVEPLRAYLDDVGTLAELTPQVAPSVWFVGTLDDEGRASVGSAVVVASEGDRSLLLTSYDTVRAATTEPAPEVTVRHGEETAQAEVYNWDPAHDLALLTIERGGLPALEWVPEDEQAGVVGSRVYAVSGMGGAGATLSPGVVLDQSADGFQHTAAIGQAWQGGPIVTGGGRVLGVASTEYRPLGFDSGDVHFAVPVQVACERVLACGDGDPGAGDEG